MKKVSAYLGKHKGITALAIILVVLVVAAAVRGRSGGAAAGYSEETASLRSITTYNSFVGNVTTASEMSVYPLASQTVTEVYVTEGDEVSKGDVIARLDTSTVEYNIAVQEAQLDSAKTSNAYNIADAQRTYENYKEAVDSGLNSSLQSAGNQVDSAYTALMNAYETYDETEYAIDSGTYSAMSSYWTEKENAASTLSSAESALNSAQSAVTTAENTLANAKTTLSNVQSSSSGAQSNLTAAQSELTAAQSTLASAQTALSTAESELSTAEANLKQAEQDKSDAEATIAAAEEIIAEEKEKAEENQDSAKIADAEKTISDAQSLIEDAELKITKYTSDVSTAEANVASAQAAVDTAQAAVASAQSAVASAQSGVTTLEEAQAAVTNAESALSSAKSTLSSAQSAYNSAYNAADTAYNNWYNQRASVLEDMQDSIDSALTAYNQALASYDSTELSVEQQLETYAANVDKTKATSSTTTSELELENLEESLEDYTILAPCDGTITELDLQVGDTVSSGMSVATISSLDAMEISISVDEYSILNTGVGSDVTVYIDSIGKSYDGVITWVANAATVSGGVSYFEATVGFTPDDDVRVGMSVEVRLVTVDRQDVVSVAAGSVNYHSDNTAYVLVQDESGNVVEKTVTLGESDGSYVEITDGLEEGDINLTTAGVTGLMDASAMEMMP